MVLGVLLSTAAVACGVLATDECWEALEVIFEGEDQTVGRLAGRCLDVLWPQNEDG
jgi:hypothetical protein